MKGLFPSYWIFILLFPISGFSQMWNGQDTLYGNEWIDFDQEYYKLQVAEDGIYQIPFALLSQNGIPAGMITADQYQLFYMGQEIPIHVSTNGILSSEDYIEFFGVKNRAELDAYLYKDAANELLNPYYSLFTDSSAYFLTWADPGVATKRYTELTNDLNNLPPKENYYWEALKSIYSSDSIKPENASDISKSYFGEGEGYATRLDNVHNLSLSPDKIYTAGDSANVQIRLTGNPRAHNLSITVQGVNRITDNFFGFRLRSYDFNILLSEEQEELTFDFQGLDSDIDRVAISNIILTYPRQFDFNNLNQYGFNLEANSGKRYVEISNFNAGSNNPVLYDYANEERMIVEHANGTVRIGVPASASNRQLWLSSKEGIQQISSLQKMNFIDFEEVEADYIIISHPLLRSDGNGADAVQEYADYRASEVGGSYTPFIVDIHQIYDQFSFGINRHAIGIRNFGHFVYRSWDAPKYMLLLGKGVEYPNMRTADKVAENAGLYFFVPTFGFPGSDNLLLSDNVNAEPVIPIGRIAAINGEEIRTYLSKVKEFENNQSLPQTLEDREWMKRIVHLGGGDIDIQASIKSHLAVIENIIETNQFGGEVSSFFKTSSEPIQISQSDVILDLINSGVSIITFFGHSGANAFDFSIDSPETYENQGKYPVFFSLGCYSGQIHGEFRGSSEDFVLEDNKAAIAFFASTSFGYVSSLRTLSENYYRLLGGSLYGSGIGDVLKSVIHNLENNSSLGVEELTQQFTLHGDPALRLNDHPGPDYIIDNKSVQFTPQKINIDLDSFELAFTIVNIGSNESRDINLTISQTFPNGGSFLVKEDRIPAPAFEQELRYNIPVFGEESIGLNKFIIRVDTDEEVEELPLPYAESNNSLIDDLGNEGISIYFISNDAKPVFPSKYGISSDQNLVLKATTSNAFAEEQNYLFQLDTTANFNSPFRKEYAKTQIGGVVSWEPGIPWEDEKVYYWRITPDSVDASGYSWQASSFLFKDEVNDGWNQSHYYQLENNRYNNMELPEESRRMKYLDDFKDITVIQGVYPNVRPEITINSEPHRYFPWNSPIRGGLLIAVLDSVSVDPWINDPAGGGDYGTSIPPWATNYAGFAFQTRTPEGRQNAQYFLDSIVPPNNYVVAISIQETTIDYEPEEWAADSIENGGRNLFQVLEEQGASLIRSSAIDGARPYYFVYRKDDPDFQILEGFSEPEDIVTRSFGLLGSWDNGYVQTDRIGPAQNWESLNWELANFNTDQDEISVDVIGVRRDSVKEVLVTGIQAFDTTLSFIDAELYPYLKLQFNSMDTFNRSSPHLNHWRIFYDGIPEMSLNPAATFTFYKDTLQQGEEMLMSIAMENISAYDMDSLLVQYSISDQNNEQQNFQQRLQPLPSGDQLIANFSLNTKDLQGPYNLIIEANPGDDQPELLHFNNIGLTNFLVDRDQRNPILDVTFDGTHIMDGDIISAKPLIVVNLQDENPFLALDDTSLFKLFLKYPNESLLRPVPLEGGNVQFFPASNQTGERNRAAIEFRPELDQDGLYEFFVQAEDVSGNQSGNFDYKVSFQVINETTISNVFNYPNPFSTSTQFVYTLTGDQAPHSFKIQILTVSGRIVREITQDELGPLRPGTHRTDFVWDGTDSFGDKLANGVYLYRIVAKDENGEDYNKYDTNTDQFFKEGFGKMVILR